MKRLKKSVFLLFLPLVLVASFRISASARSDSPVSPALSIIANELQMRKSGLVETSLYFTSEDFEIFTGVKNLKSITVTTLPSEFEGKLYLGDVPVVSNQTIYKADMSSLCFKPASAAVSSSNFRFTGSELSCQASVRCSLYLLPELNSAPTVSVKASADSTLTTQKNIMVYSSLEADDPENDGLIFEIVTTPQHGIATITDPSTGKFTYTPAIDYTGKDSFEYIVYDVYGNRSPSAWVDVKVNKTNDAFFADMLRHEDHNAAVKATEYDIMSGKLVGGRLCFAPDEEPTKAEFTAMALKAAKINVDSVSVSSGFTDDSDIPASLKKYVAYAAQKGYITGTKTDSGVYFYPNSPVTRAEAAVIVGAILRLGDAESPVEFSDAEDIPSWAEKDVAALTQSGVIEAMSDGSYSPNSNVTNVQAAKILCAVFEMLNG